METQGKRYQCSISGLPVLELPEFTNVDFGHGYKLNLRKIGDSVVHCRNEGNMKYSDINRYYSAIESFIEKANVSKPYIEIRDLTDLTGRAPSREFQTQVKYLKDHELDIAGFYVCHASGLVELIIKSAFKLIKTNFPIDTCKDYEEAIKLVIEQKDQKRLISSISMDDIFINPDWGIKTEQSEVKYGAIPKKVLFTSLNGVFQTQDIQNISKQMQKVLEDAELEGREYIRIADYSNLQNISFRTRSLYGKEVDAVNKRKKSKPIITYLCGANSYIKAAMRIYRVTTQQEIIFVDTLEQAFQIINNKSKGKNQKKKRISVSQAEIDEIIHLGGSLIWGENKRIDHLVSKSNPLRKVAETLSVVQGDLYELREKDVEQNRVLRETLDKTQKLAKELHESDEETQQLNEELRAANDQLFTQKEELEYTQSELLKMNNNLENLVKERTEKLSSTVKKLNKSVSELDRFVYSASHDLSAPLKSILGLLHIARKDPDKDLMDKYLEYIEKSIYNLEDVIKSLISYSRNSRLEIKNEPFNLHELVSEVIAELAFLPLTESLSFQVELDQNQIINTDRQRLKVILHNLINNSLKYADYEKSNPHVLINYHEKSGHGKIMIKDNGIGIGPDQLEKVFEMFYRGTEKSKGSGLGLFIVKETVSTLGGSIKVQSEFGKETEFIVNIPGQTASNQP